MKATIQDLVITIFGAISSLLTAVILFWIESHWNLSIYSFMLWFVIPVGAIGSGFVAAGGYYLGSILFNHKPKGTILLNMVAISIGTYFLIQYLDYLFLEIEGQRIADAISFWSYWDVSISHQSVQFSVKGRSVGDAIDLGNMGYVYACLQVIGFAIGGFAVYGYLASQVYCDKCSRYFSKKGVAARYTGDSDALQNFLKKLAVLLEESKLSEIISLHANEGGSKVFDAKQHHLQTQIEIKKCKNCNKHHLKFSVSKKNKDDWKELDELSFSTFSDLELTPIA